LHAHTTWSDGDLSLSALVDLYGSIASTCVGLLVIPGLELTDDNTDPLRGAHALAIGLRSFVPVALGLRIAVQDARRAGAAIVAAHPHALGENARNTCRWWYERDAPVIRPERYELFNRRDCFTWVAERDLPCVATGDFHRDEHLRTWKTLLPCDRDERAIVAFLRSDERPYLTPFSGGPLPVVERVAA
jgi:hypothetical protein